jgi:hypothetical protein
MPTILVESYTACAQPDELPAAAARVRAAARAAQLRYVRSIFVPEDETCFHVLEGPSVEAVREALERAQLTPERVVAAVSTSRHERSDERADR